MLFDLGLDGAAGGQADVAGDNTSQTRIEGASPLLHSRDPPPPHSLTDVD
jgi:hypothetical protein